MSCKAENSRKDRQNARRNLAEAQKYYNVTDEEEKEHAHAIDYAGFSKRILGASNVTLIGGPFHYTIRSPTYGDPYDEIPWKVRMGMESAKPRHGYENNPLVCQYEPRVLLSNWVEERRDRGYIKYNRPKLSQFGHHYISEVMRAYTKPVCNKARDVLLNMAKFPFTSHPGHQPELNVDTLRMSAPKPEECVVDENIALAQKQMDKDKRYYKASL